jgi:cell division protein FtsI (penicillin-binding protein 3)
MNLRKSILVRTRIASIGVLVFAILIMVQAFNLAVVNREEFVKKSEEQSVRLREVKAIRGNILSRDGRLLATSLPKYDIRFDTRASGITDELFATKLDSLATLFSIHFKEKSYAMWKSYLQNARKGNDKYLLISRNVSYELAKEMTSWPIFRMGRYSGGLIKEEHNQREMPFGQLARRTIGFTTREGKSVGLEYAFDSLLRGMSGKRLEQRVSGSVWRPIGNTEFRPDNGCDIVTTLDINIQDVAEDALRRALIHHNCQSGSAILMEVETGAIRAIANFTKKGEGAYFEDMNIGISIASDPGSTFKLASALALLEEGVVNSLEDSVMIYYGKRKFADREMEDAHLSSFNKVTFRYAFENSSNVGIASLVDQTFKTQPQRFVDYLSKLHLDRPLGIQIKEEGNIRIKLPTDKDWSQVSLPWLSIGYESRITPLQTLAMYNAIANNGVLVKPFFVSEIKRLGKTLWKHETEVLNSKVCSKKTVDNLRSLLEGVVENGTAKNLKGMEYKVAGKTGTAQILTGTQYDKGSHKASFVGYFPADKPKYTCIVVINAPRGGVYYGSLVAGPVFKEIADKVYATLSDIHPVISPLPQRSLPVVKHGISKDIKEVLNTLGISSYTREGQTGSEWVSTYREPNTIRLQTKQLDMNLMPDVRGMGARDALFLLESMDVEVSISGYGKVVSQSIAPGTKIKSPKVILVLK